MNDKEKLMGSGASVPPAIQAHTWGSGAFLGSGAFVGPTVPPVLVPTPSQIVAVPSHAPLTASKPELEKVHLEFPLQKGTAFPDRNWDPYLRAQAVVIDFCTRADWRSELELGAYPDDAALEQEIGTLVALARLRVAHQAEIILQATSPFLYFGHLLNLFPPNAPKLWTLIATTHTIAQLVAMHFKSVYKRARPVQVYPALAPLITTPPHPSYPNSHALEAGLTATFLADIFPSRRAELLVLADHIGWLREIAGLHFPSDREASFHLVAQVKPMLAASPVFAAIFDDAKAENP